MNTDIYNTYYLHIVVSCNWSSESRPKPIPVPWGLRRRSAAARFKKLCVRILLKSWLFISCVCVVKVVDSSTTWSLVQKDQTGCGCLLVCDLQTSTMRRYRPGWTVAPPKLKKNQSSCLLRICYPAVKCLRLHFLFSQLSFNRLNM